MIGKSRVRARLFSLQALDGVMALVLIGVGLWLRDGGWLLAGLVALLAALFGLSQRLQRWMFRGMFVRRRRRP